MVEEFTNASCPPCATYNPGFNAILNANSTNVVAVKYQVNWPGVDPMNAHNPTEVASMVSLYGVNGVPDAVIDGNVWHNNPGNFNQSVINNRASVPSPFSISLSHSFNNDYSEINVSGVVTAAQSFSTGTILRVAVIERDIHFCSPPGTNGETHFEGVMKKMLPNQAGTTMPATWTNGQTEPFNFTWSLANVYDKTSLAVVAWILNPSTKEVHQAAYSAPLGIPDDARITCMGISGIGTVNCNTSINPSFEVKNNGLNTLSSLNISYALNGGTPNISSWSGSLAPGATTIVSLPSIALTVGSNTLAVNILDPNGTTDFNTYYDNASRTFSVVPPTGAAIPLVQDFTALVFPPAGWFVDNPDNGITWIRSNAGFQNVGSARIGFYNISSGNIDDMWLEAQDFTGQTAINLDFDVAYAQYSASYNDRIQVQVSTDCGANWATVWNKAGSALATVPPQTGAFTPNSPAQWRHETVSLNNFIGQPLVFIRFRAISAYGNNAYIDNINVATPTSVNTSDLSQSISLYPTLSSGSFNLKVNFEKSSELRVEVFNLTGQEVASFNEGKVISNIFHYDLNNLAEGLYTVRIIAGAGTTVRQLQIIK